jgi:hypothetical protein
LSTMKIRKHRHSGYFNSITLFVGIDMLFYVINLDDVNLFADSSFSYVLYLFE